MRGIASIAKCFIVGAALSGCVAPTPFASPPDANVDAWHTGGLVGPGIRTGGGTGNDAGSTTTTGCRARILVVFDRSASMETVWTGTSTSGPRWQIAETALASALEPHASQLTVGALLFPSSDWDPSAGPGCAPVDPIASQIPFQSCSSFLGVWASTWSSPTLLGTTPIDSAFDAADAALSGAGAETAVVLLTDGEPTCTGATSAESHAASWHARGIETWVVGLPGSEAGASYLAALASAGGTSTPISVDDPSALGTALSGIAGTQVENQCGH